jgi:hypothetical protein
MWRKKDKTFGKMVKSVLRGGINETIERVGDIAYFPS